MKNKGFNECEAEKEAEKAAKEAQKKSAAGKKNPPEDAEKPASPLDAK